ncbi:hypothetical protein CNMCM5623_006108 [Aspergillus felis]|uniref:Uncharacterized protein n=1 Tax=Aspergillus felis TaxID=1287682 RepID=A0A8H6V0T5_9EURO|nr:hypothetical protein CNMCM5623_006108 [Aspergillus felis]
MSSIWAVDQEYGHLSLQSNIRHARSDEVRAGEGHLKQHLTLSQVLGVDLRPGGSSSDVPNCTFAAADVQGNWDWLPTEPVDFIYIRGIVGFVDSWPDLFTRAFNCLAPGGWLEVADICYDTASDDGSLLRAHGLRRFDQLFQETLVKMGQDPRITPTLGQKMESAGFRPTLTAIHKTAFSDWSDDPEMKQTVNIASRLHEMDTIHIVERGIKPVLHLSANDADIVLAEALRDMRNIGVHAYRPW